MASHHLRVDDRLHTVHATLTCIARLLEGLRFALLLWLFVLHSSRHCGFFLQLLVGTKVWFCCNNAFFQSFRELFASFAIQYGCKSPHYRSNNECFWPDREILQRVFKSTFYVVEVIVCESGISSATDALIIVSCGSTKPLVNEPLQYGHWLDQIMIFR